MTFWYDSPIFERIELSDELADLICERGSLTNALRQRVETSLGVDVRSSGWQRPWPDEAQLFEQSIREVCWIREVLLLDGKIPLVYGRSVWPRKSISGRQRHYRYLKQTPLGDKLFREPTLWRSDLEFATIKDSPARRSRFTIEDKPMLITEIFLPKLFQQT